MSAVIGNPLLLGPEGYQISRSVRLRSSASAYFNRTPGSTTNQTTWTYSAWIKRGALSTGEFISASDSTGGTNFDAIDVDSNTFRVYFNGTSSAFLVTTAVYRDPSAWYHLVVSVDTTQATASNRIKMYVNGVQVTSFSTSTYPSQNYATFFNLNGRKNTIGANAQTSPGQFFDGYLTEINFIDGQALTPSSFGESNATTGVWQPKKYTGTYGTNGFYLNFSDNSNNTAATIGKDYSGNGNNWTPNNISVTSGATYDSMLDVPTMWADGGNGRGNYAVLNPLNSVSGGTLSNANLTWQSTAGAVRVSTATTTIISSSKTYFEMTVTTVAGAGGYAQIGIVPFGKNLSADIGNTSGSGYSIEDNQSSDIRLRLNGSSVTVATAVVSGDTLQVAIDQSTGKLWFGRNNVWYNSTGGTTGNPAAGTNETATVSTTTDWYPAISKYDTLGSYSVNFGQRPFTYTPPSGFVALNTQNLPDSTIKKGNQYFDATTYTGNGSTQTITNSGAMQPDFAWIKSRSNALNSGLMDSVRGPTKLLISNATNAEQTLTDELTSFNSNGFSLGASSNGYTNFNTYTYVAWQWKAGGSGSSNTSGSITSTVSVNATAGFSIVTYTGTGANATVGHGLGVAPQMVIVKPRSVVGSWAIYNLPTAASRGSDHILSFDTSASFSAPTAFQSTQPTSSSFSVGTSTSTNGNGTTYVAYLFAEVAGFSKFGSYTGNGSSDGPFVYLGFRPRFIMTKRTDSTSDWQILDTSRNTYNVAGSALFPNSSSSETTNGWYDRDFLSNGFKIRASVTEVNASGGTYVYACFAESPFKLALAR